MNAIPYVFLKGNVSVSGDVVNIRSLQNRKENFPQGVLNGEIANLVVRLKDMEQLLPGIVLSDIVLSEIRIDVEYGSKITLKQIKLKGDLEGIIGGTIQLNPRNVLSSRISLHAKIELSKNLMKELAAVSMVLKQFQCGNVIDVDINGTFQQMSFPKRRCT